MEITKFTTAYTTIISEGTKNVSFKDVYTVTKNGPETTIKIKSGDTFPYKITEIDEGEFKYRLSKGFSARINMPVKFSTIKKYKKYDEAITYIIQKHNKSRAHMKNWPIITEAYQYNPQFEIDMNGQKCPECKKAKLEVVADDEKLVECPSCGFDSDRYLDKDAYSNPFASSEGWNEEALEDVGLMSWMQNVAQMMYDIKNCRRGAYCRNLGTTKDSLVRYLENTMRELENIISDIENYKE